jgi:hypothetical protein
MKKKDAIIVMNCSYLMVWTRLNGFVFPVIWNIYLGMIEMELFDNLNNQEKFEGETKFNKNIKRAAMLGLVGLAIGFFINELISFLIFCWGYFC